MCDLTAQVTSSLLPFPQVTIDALGEDEITVDAVLQGRFSVGRSGTFWLACGPQLEVVHAVTGERLSAYCFSGGGEHPPRVLAARDFNWVNTVNRSGLLVGLEEAESSILCLYDLGLSRVVKAVAIPGRIVAIEPLVSCGGASASTQHLHQRLRWFFGIAAVVTDLGHVLLVDLCLDDLSCSQSELEASDLEVVPKWPAEISRLREVSSRQGKHLCFQLNDPTGTVASGTAASSLQYIPRTNQLALGFSDGHLQLWNMKTLKKEYHAPLKGGRVPVHAFTFQEPENNSRNCCYLWAVQSAQDLEGDVLSLHLLQLAFRERKCLSSGRILYEGLEYCDECFSQDLSGTSFPLRVQTSNSRLLSCQTIEKFRPHPDRDDSMNEAPSPDTSVSMFTWQCKANGQVNPSTYIGVFDINRLYHAPMPDSLRSGESLRSCPYLAVWSLDPAVEMVSPRPLLDVLVYDRSLSRGLPFTCPPPEQLFNPTTYNFDATCLFNSGIVHLTCSGYQKEEEQLDAILSTAVETSSLGLITGCIKHWTAEEQPGSAMNLRYILKWAWNKVVSTKEELDGICAPLFDSSSNFTDPQTLQLLQHSQRLLGNLSTIFQCLLNEAHDLTQRGLVGLMNKNMVSSLISNYAQVVLWFCRTEGSGDDALQIPRPFYSHTVLSNYYTIRREDLSKLAKGRWCSDCLMIDGLVGECGEHLVELWKRDEGGTGQYPPPTLHALLDIDLLENIEEATKHAIVTPTAFAIPIGLDKLVQGLWLLDHHDHQSAVELLLNPTTSQCQFTWQHDRVLQALMIQGHYPAALRYFHISKPPLSSTPRAKLCLSVLLHNRCLVEAWSLLRQHSSLLNMEELMGFLYESCQELGLIKELLKLPLGLNEQECLERLLQETGGLHNREVLMVHPPRQTLSVCTAAQQMTKSVTCPDELGSLASQVTADYSQLALQGRLAAHTAEPEEVQQENLAKRTRLHCDVDNNLISSAPCSTDTTRKTITRVGRRGSVNGQATNHDRSKEKPNGRLEETTAVDTPTSPPRTTLLGTIFSPVFNFFSPAKNASSGSDSPDQAAEVEEIVKQLDMEQVEETPTSTAISAQEQLCSSSAATSNLYSSVAQVPQPRAQHVPVAPPAAEDGELEPHADLPPLTAPGSSPETAYVDAPPNTVPAEVTYEEDWEVFDPPNSVDTEVHQPRDTEVSSSPPSEDAPLAEDVPPSEDVPSEMDSLDRIEIAGWTYPSCSSPEEHSCHSSLRRNTFVRNTPFWRPSCSTPKDSFIWSPPDHMNECSEVSPDTVEEQTTKSRKTVTFMSPVQVVFMSPVHEDDGGQEEGLVPASPGPKQPAASPCRRSPRNIQTVPKQPAASPCRRSPRNIQSVPTSTPAKCRASTTAQTRRSVNKQTPAKVQEDQALIPPNHLNPQVHLVRLTDAHIKRLSDDLQKHQGEVIVEMVGGASSKKRIRAPSTPSRRGLLTPSRRVLRSAGLPSEEHVSLTPATRNKRPAVSIAPQDEDVEKPAAKATKRTAKSKK